MNSLALLLFIPLGAAGFVLPWAGVVIYYGFAILSPESIWPDFFAGTNPAQWIILPTLAGFAFKIHRGGYWAATIRNPRNAMLALLWIAFVLSYFFGAYTQTMRPDDAGDPYRAIETMSKQLLLYFLGSVCIDRERRLKALFVTFLLCVACLALGVYLQESLDGVSRRIVGAVDADGMGRWNDPNYFAAVFVVSVPVLWNLGFALKNRLAGLACWLGLVFVVPIVFWTGSRGGLLSLAVVTLLLTLRSRYRVLGLLFIPFMLGAFLFAGNELVFERADSIAEYRDDESAISRLDAAGTAVRMIFAHPIFGVGAGSFMAAYPNFSNQVPIVAHNTLLQIAAEAGLAAGLIALTYVVHCMMRLARNGRRLHRILPKGHDSLYWMNEAALGALVAFMACAMFLSMHLFQLFYLVCLFTGSALYLADRRIASIRRRSARRLALSRRAGRRRRSARRPMAPLPDGLQPAHTVGPGQPT